MSERSSVGLGRGRRRRTPPGWPCAQAPGPELEAGTIVGTGRFVVGAVLGHGGMATVYRGHDRRLGRDVALKVMHDAARHGARYESRVRRFEREASLLERLPVHPGLVRRLHAGRLPELAQRPFLATEPIEGPTLAFRLAADLRMPTRHTVALGLGIAGALVAVHGVGVVHRDLTARNVMLRHAGEDALPILVDFGLAAVLEPEAGALRITRHDQRPGTVTAMAPEQYRGRPAHPSMDLYALGRLLYEMLAAEDPHATVSHAQLLEHHRDGARVAPRLVGRGDVGTAELRALIDACLEPDPGLRPTAEDVAAALGTMARALERGATVLPFVRASERAVIAMPQAPLPSTAARGRAGRGWVAALVCGAAGVVLAATGWPPSAAVDGTIPAGVREVERVAVAWPSMVVPLDRRAPMRSSAELTGSPTAPLSRRSTAEPARALPARAAPHERACTHRREQARAAARRWAWPEVLEATTDPTCWPEAGERTRLRLVAWIEQQRFDACEEEGAHEHDPALVRLVERCRQRRGPSPLARVPAPEAESGREGGSP